MPVTKEILDEIALTRAEYDMIVDLLDREPNEVELGMFGALWSEHCGYKHSKPLLRLFPSKSPRVLSTSGAENAGVVDLGELGILPDNAEDYKRVEGRVASPETVTEEQTLPHMPLLPTARHRDL